jgi:anti-sigma B factor antagonist
MKITVASTPGRPAVVHLSGRLDLLSAAEVKRQLAETVSAGHARLVIDLGGVSFIDSSGLGALIGGLKAARVAGGDLRIANPNEQAKVILSLTTLDRVLKAYGSVEEALTGY